MKTLRIIILILSGAIPMIALLTWSGANPSQPTKSGPVATAPGNGSTDAPAPGVIARLRWKRTQEGADWNHLMEFLKTNCPNRYQMISQHPNFPRLALLRRWQVMEQEKTRQPKVYELAVEQMRTEDQVIGLLVEIRNDRAQKDTIAEGEAYQKIRDSAADLVNLNLEMRELRLTNIQALLSQAKQDLDRDKDKVPALVQDRTSQIIMQAKKLSLLDGPPPTDGSHTQSPGDTGK